MKYLLLLFLVSTFLSISKQESCPYSFPSIVRIDDLSTDPRTFWYVDIYNGTETNFIRDAIRNCTTVEYSHKVTLYFYIFFNGPVSIELDIGNSITNIRFPYSSSSDAIQVSSLKVNPSVTFLGFYLPEFVIPQSNFFELFPGLERVTSNNLSFNSVPTFNNMNLTYLVVSIQIENGFVLDRSFTRGLDSLQYLYLVDSGIIFVSLDTFTGMGELVVLSLDNNLLSHLQPRVFEGLSNLVLLNLDKNRITVSSPESFQGLNSLTYLTVAMNPGFPTNSLIGLKSLRVLDIGYNGYTSLSPFPFQQLEQLTFLGLNNNPFECGCELQWLSMVSTYDVFVQDGVCSYPNGSSVSSSLTYLNCRSLEEFVCFNKSIECPYNQVCQNVINQHYCCCPENFRLTDTGECVAVPHCHSSDQTILDTLDGCGCEVGFSLSSNCSVCEDLNECETNNGDCEQNCVNTIGSHSCTCNHGYRLVNTSFCEDINECETPIPTCHGYCENTPGSSLCHCWEGYAQINTTYCSDVNECDVSNGNCQQLCFNTQGSYSCGCYEGYNHTMNNLHFCYLVTQSATIEPPESLYNWSNPTMVIATVCVIVVLFILLICQTIVCLVVVVVCRKKPKQMVDTIELKSPNSDNINSINNYKNTENNNNNKTGTDMSNYVEMHKKYYTLEGGTSNLKSESPFTESVKYETIRTQETLYTEGNSPTIVYGQFDTSIEYENPNCDSSV